MKTEKQVEKMLEAIDEETVNILNRKRKEYTERYNKATNDEDRRCYAQWLLALMDIVDALGYDWDLKDEIAVRVKLFGLEQVV